MPRVLVVDDEPNHARVMAIGLRVEGFEVETAADAERALGALAGTACELAVVDLMMPGTNGIQLARLIRERHPQTRVVLMSAYHLSERQLLRADCGAVGFVPKPFDSDGARALLEGQASHERDPPPPRGRSRGVRPFRRAGGSGLKGSSGLKG